MYNVNPQLMILQEICTDNQDKKETVSNQELMKALQKIIHNEAANQVSPHSTNKIWEGALQRTNLYSNHKIYI